MFMTFIFASVMVFVSLGIFKFKKDKRLADGFELVRQDVSQKMYHIKKGISDATSYRVDGNFGAGVKGDEPDVDYAFHDLRYGGERKVEDVKELVAEARFINTEIFETFGLDSEKVKDKEYEVLSEIRELETMAKEVCKGVFEYDSKTFFDQNIGSIKGAEDRRMFEAHKIYQEIIEVCNEKYAELENNKEFRKGRD